MEYGKKIIIKIMKNKKGYDEWWDKPFEEDEVKKYRDALHKEQDLKRMEDDFQDLKRMEDDFYDFWDDTEIIDDPEFFEKNNEK